MAYRVFQRYRGFEFMEELVEAMTAADPRKRPAIEGVMTKFSHIRDSLNEYKLRSLITARKDPTLVKTFRQTRHVFRTVHYIVLRKPAIPDYTISDAYAL